jgi:hypothetical protein
MTDLDQKQLTQDELTILMIAATGEPMMPIGRWKAPAESLVKRGFLKGRTSPQDPEGMFNLHITSEGMTAAEKGEDDSYRQVIEVSSSIQHEQRKARKHAEQIAVQLVDLAEASSKVTGDAKVDALRRWSEIILTRALEMRK